MGFEGFGGRLVWGFDSAPKPFEINLDILVYAESTLMSKILASRRPGVVQGAQR